MGVDTPDDSYRRAGDLLQMQQLEELRYLRKRLDTVLDNMATKADVVQLGNRLDAEVRALKSEMGKVAADAEAHLQTQRADLAADLTRHEESSKEQRQELAGRIKLNATAIEALKKDRLPPWFWPATAALAAVVSTLATLAYAWSAWHH